MIENTGENQGLAPPASQDRATEAAPGAGQAVSAIRSVSTGALIFEPQGLFGQTVDPDEGRITVFGYLSEGPGQPVFGLDVILERPVEELLAYARLIASAPELYEALANAETMVAAGAYCSTTLAQIRAALAKARGEKAGDL